MSMLDKIPFTFEEFISVVGVTILIVIWLEIKNMGDDE